MRKRVMIVYVKDLNRRDLLKASGLGTFPSSPKVDRTQRDGKVQGIGLEKREGIY